MPARRSLGGYSFDFGPIVRDGFTVEEVVSDDGRVTGIRGHGRGGASVVEPARVVIGADGRNSVVATAVQAAQYEDRPPLTVGYYSYWSDLPTDTFEAYSRPGRGWAVCPTNDHLTLVVGGWPYAELLANRTDVEAALMATFAMSPAFAERIRAAERQERFVGTSVPNYFRKPYGPGWALVGDAGYSRDFITAQGITDAFLDAERCAQAVGEAPAGTLPYEQAMAGYHSGRDARAMPVYQMTLQIASLQPPDDQMIQLLSAIAGRQDAMDAFARLNSGVTSPAEFFAPQNPARMAGSGT